MRIKILTLILSLGLSCSAMAQLGNWNARAFLYGGFEYKVYNVDTGLEPTAVYDRWSHPEVELNTELFHKNIYMGVDVSILPDIVGVFVGKNVWVRDADIFPIRMAFGAPIGEHLALYGGVQYQFSVMGNDDDLDLHDGQDDLISYETTVGGHMRGFGGHAIYGGDHVLFRYSFLYDWVNRGDKFGAVGLHKGKSVAHEIQLNVDFGGFGLYTKGIFRNTVMNETPNIRSIDGQNMSFYFGVMFELLGD